MSATMTAQLVTDALMMAIWRRGKPDALRHHSDQGSQYTSEQFQRFLGLWLRYLLGGQRAEIDSEWCAGSTISRPRSTLIDRRHWLKSPVTPPVA